MFTDIQLEQIKNAIESGLRLREAVKSVSPEFKTNTENMQPIKQMLFEAYPELRPEVRKLRLENRIAKLETQKSTTVNPEEISSIELVIEKLREQLNDL
jgi:uncharacterized protein with WD repeat